MTPDEPALDRSAPDPDTLHALVGPARTCEVARESGFSPVAVAASTELNLVYELRP
jgi:hypothetical protein